MFDIGVSILVSLKNLRKIVRAHHRVPCRFYNVTIIVTLHPGESNHRYFTPCFMTGNTLIYCYQNGKLGSLINLYTNRKI